MSLVKRGILAAVVLAALAAIVVASLRARAGKETKVYAEPVARREMVRLVKASGEIDPRVKVKISAHVVGRIEKLYVQEGGRIEAGQPFLELERAAFVAARRQAAAQLASAETAVRQAEVDLADARLQLKRFERLAAEGVAAQERLDAARLKATSAELTVSRSREAVHQAQAALDKAADDLAKTTIYAPISGRVIDLDAEAGEVVVSGTMNNPASVIGTIADLSEILAVVDVDETEIVDVEVGQEATVGVDAVPGRSYHGRVVEIGSSGYDRPRQPDVTYFGVKVLVADADDLLRPGMSARVEIRTAAHLDALAVPIQAVVERTRKESGGGGGSGSAPSEARPAPSTADAEKATDGEKPAAADREPPKPPDEVEKVVFVVADGKAVRRPVTTGITDTTHVEITSGLTAGEQVVTGPYRTLRDLADGEAVRVVEPESEKEKSGGIGRDGKDGRDGKEGSGG